MLLFNLADLDWLHLKLTAADWLHLKLTAADWLHLKLTDADWLHLKLTAADLLHLKLTDADLGVAVLCTVIDVHAIGASVLRGGVSTGSEAVLGTSPTRDGTGAPGAPGGPQTVNYKK